MKKLNINLSKILVLLVVITLVLLVFFNLNKSLLSAPDAEPFYQYSVSIRYDFLDTSKIKMENNQAVVYKDGYPYNLDFSPIYYKERDKILLPYDYSVVDFNKDKFTQERLMFFTTIEKNNVNYSYRMNLDEGEFDGKLLFDGKNTYLVLEKAYYSVDGTTYSIPEMSFINYLPSLDVLRVYDYEKDEVYLYQNPSMMTITLPNENWQVELINNVVYLSDNKNVKKLLLSRLDYLDLYKH